MLGFWNAVAGTALFVGLAVLSVDLLFVHERTRFRRLVVVGLALAIGGLGLFAWLVRTTFADGVAG